MSETHPGDDLVALALDDLDPHTRAATVEHLLACPRCREEYDALAAAVEATLVAAPAVGPPPGFEKRVLAALRVEAPSPGRERVRRSPRAVWLLAAASALVGLALGAGATYTIEHRSATASTASPGTSPGSDLKKADGTVVGTVSATFVGRKEVYVIMVRTGPVGMRYTCELKLQDGSTLPGGRWRLTDQPAVWIVPRPRAAVTQLVLVANDGKGPVWSKASL